MRLLVVVAGAVEAVGEALAEAGAVEAGQIRLGLVAIVVGQVGLT